MLCAQLLCPLGVVLLFSFAVYMHQWLSGYFNDSMNKQSIL